MALEDFEKSLAEGKLAEEAELGKKTDRKDKEHRHHHHHHRHQHRSRREEDDGHRSKRRRRSRDEDDADGERKRHRRRNERDGSRGGSPLAAGDASKEVEGVADVAEDEQSATAQGLTRDSWMERPSELVIEHVHRKAPEPAKVVTSSRSSKADFELKIHENEMNKHHLQDMRDGKDPSLAALDKPAQHEVDYTFGDSGAQWRMMKLKGVYRQTEESGQSIEDVALKQYGDLRSFDEAREEEQELDRRNTYGENYVGKEKPSGELFQERKLDAGMRRGVTQKEHEEQVEPSVRAPTEQSPGITVVMDQTALNKLRAQTMKAKLRKAPNAAELEAQYNAAAAAFASGQPPEVVLLGTMENRMLAGGRATEVKSVDNRRGRERGNVEENEDMSIDDMVREERRTRGQAGGEGKRFAERIAKDGKFDNDLEYMDENAAKLAKRVQKSEINLRNTAVSDFQKLNRQLDNCPLCHHEDTNTPPTAPVVSLATRVYLTLPTEPDISSAPGGACIVPIQHRKNLLECDDDEWEEMRNFMKALTRMYDARDLSVLFYENAARPEKHQHAMMAAVPMPPGPASTAPAFFREAILAAAPEWSQHKKLVDTAAAARKGGMGRLAFRRSLVKEAPYFHVWFSLDGGLGHVVEDGGRWPRGDMFARETLGGMLGKGLEVVRGRGKWVRGDRRVDGFRKRWDAWDWTKALVEEEEEHAAALT